MGGCVLELGIDVSAIVSSARASKGSLIEALSDACNSFYLRDSPNVELTVFSYRGAEFLFHADPLFDKTVLAVGHPSAPSESRDVTYQRGYPLVDTVGGRRVDRGHLIPFSADGSLGPNLYVQDRALNRGWSREGRQYRALERLAVAAGPSALMFVHPIYVDGSAVPGFVQLGVITDSRVETQVFRNRFDDVAVGSSDRLSVELSGATDAQIGALGEETVAVLLEEELDAIVVALGDAGLERTEGRQDLDVVAIQQGNLIAFEVKSRYSSDRAGRLTRAGNLYRPRLRSSGAGHRQGSQPYVADRIAGLVDTDDGYEGVDVQVVVVDFVAMLAQFFAADDRGRRLVPLGQPMPCRDAARSALERIREHRGCL
jgi:hypothetical protein